MALFRKIMVFCAITAGIMLAGRLAGRYLPRTDAKGAAQRPPAEGRGAGSGEGREDREQLRDSTNALPAFADDTTGAHWHALLFDPLERAYGLGPRSARRKSGYFEIKLPKGKPIHEYALEIEKLCRARGITVVAGAELRPPNRSVEYLLEKEGARIKLRATLGSTVMAGAARLAIVFAGLDSVTLSQAQALLETGWDKTLILDPYSGNPAVRALRDGNGRTEILAELPMEPAAYPYIDPGPHALYIHHGREDVERILGEALDSIPRAQGFASRYGDRAIENQPLLEKLFAFTAARKLAFLDLTGSQRSLARQAAIVRGARNRSLEVIRDAGHPQEELARKVAFAQKSGEAVLAVAWSERGFSALRNAIEENAERFEAIGLELVGLSDLAEPEEPSVPGDANPPAEKQPAEKTGAKREGGGAKAQSVRPAAGRTPGAAAKRSTEPAAGRKAGGQSKPPAEPARKDKTEAKPKAAVKKPAAK